MSTDLRTDSAAIRARMDDLVTRWARGLGVNVVAGYGAPRLRDVFVAVETATLDDAVIVGAALRLACASDVRVDPAEDDLPPIAVGAFTEASLAALLAQHCGAH